MRYLQVFDVSNQIRHDREATVHCSFKNESLEPAEDGMTVLPGARAIFSVESGKREGIFLSLGASTSQGARQTRID